METIVVTGASRGIGAATAVRLSHPSRRLVLVARGIGRLEETARRCSGPTHLLSADLSAPTASDSLLRGLEKLQLVPDGWVLNAGMANGEPFGRSDTEAVEREYRLNYLTPLHLLRHELPRFKARGAGRVTVVASLTSVVPFPGNATYAASKAALFALVRSLRPELRGTGVHLGIVLPGFTRTAMTKNHDSRWLSPMSAEAVGRHVARAFERRTSIAVPGALNGAALRFFGRFPRFSEHVLRLPGLVVTPDHVDA